MCLAPKGICHEASTDESWLVARNRVSRELQTGAGCCMMEEAAVTSGSVQA